jgi:hypothetical protein
MKNIYSAVALLILLSLSSCSKDFLEKYDNRVVGTWRITDVDRRGLGGNINNLAFTQGTFVFSDGGQLTYTDASNNVYTGRWDIIKKYTNEETRRGLEISVADFANQHILSEYYDDMNFVGTNHFRTTIYSGGHSYITHFRR